MIHAFAVCTLLGNRLNLQVALFRVTNTADGSDAEEESYKCPNCQPHCQPQVVNHITVEPIVLQFLKQYWTDAAKE